jgi:GNAT superfamily N-acetyltransferase
MGVEIRQGRTSDREAIEAFLAEAYGTRAAYKGPERWTWQFERNPFAFTADGSVPVWIAVDDGRVVGQIALQQAALKIEDDTVPAGWIVDVMVLQSHRGGGLGHLLYEAVARDVDILVTLTMAEATRRMAERLGAITLGDVHQLSRPVRLDPESVRRYLLARTIYHPWAHRLARVGCAVFQAHRAVPAVANPLLRLRDRRMPAMERTHETTITEVMSFGADVDELWEHARRDYPVIFPRDTRFLNWRFVECPEPSYRRFVAARDGRTVGYVVLRFAESVELRQGMIVDLFAERRDTATIEALVLHSLAFFGTEIAAVDCASSIAEVESVLRRFGFFRTRTARPTCVCRDDRLRERLAELRHDWFFSKGDHDWDQIHVAGADPD